MGYDSHHYRQNQKPYRDHKDQEVKYSSMNRPQEAYAQEHAQQREHSRVRCGSNHICPATDALVSFTENISRNRDSAKTLRTVNFHWVPLAIEMLPFEIAVVHPVLSDKWKVTCRASPLVTTHHLTNRRSKLAVQPAWLRAKQR